MNIKNQLLALLLMIATAPVIAQSSANLNNDWSVYSENNETGVLKDTIFLGRSCFRMDGKKTAVALKKSGAYKSFRVDVDIAGQVMSGIGFHVGDIQNYQFLYFRPGYGNTREAIQYVPIYNGALSWVIYNYPTYEKTADIKSLDWFHATIEVRGKVMRVYVNYASEPAMEINLIETNDNDGRILLRSMFGTTYFSGFSVREMPDVIDHWQLSEQLPGKATLEQSPTQVVKWTKVQADASGIVNVARYIKEPNGVVMAKRILRSDASKEAILHFDFAGRMKIYLNGKQVFYYEKQKLDRIFPGTLAIPLSLNKGDNELLVISEGDAAIFGKGFNAMGRQQHQNWGFVAEIANLR